MGKIKGDFLEHVAEAQYYCANDCDDHYEHGHEEGTWVRHCYPPNMLYWHKDGFYCEDCIDNALYILLEAKSLSAEIVLSKLRGFSYCPLPEPITEFIR